MRPNRLEGTFEAFIARACGAIAESEREGEQAVGRDDVKDLPKVVQAQQERYRKEEHLLLSTVL